MPPCPKPAPHKKHKPKNNPRPTIEDRCEYPGCYQGNAHAHEVFFGNGRRQLSIATAYKSGCATTTTRATWARINAGNTT